jgi:hypothetical protein
MRCRRCVGEGGNACSKYWRMGGRGSFLEDVRDFGGRCLRRKKSSWRVAESNLNLGKKRKSFPIISLIIGFVTLEAGGQ